MTNTEFGKLAGGRLVALLDRDDVATQFSRDCAEEPLYLAAFPLGHQPHSPVGQVLHETGDGKPRGNLPGRVAEADALNPSMVEHLAVSHGRRFGRLGRHDNAGIKA